MERWRCMEQLELINKRQPVFAGDLISKVMTKKLVDAGLVKLDRNGDYILTNDGSNLMSLWLRIDNGTVLR